MPPESPIDPSDRVFERLNPLTGAVASRAAAMDATAACAVVDAAQEAFEAWSQTPPNGRRARLNAAGDALAARGDEIVAAMVAEIGATEAWARFNIGLGVAILREAAALTTQITGQVIPSDKPGCLAMAVRQPAGVVLGMAPWNAPVILAVRAVATPLACGNTVVLKASEVCPRTHALVIEALRDAGLPPGVAGVVTNAPADAGDVVGALIDHPAVRRVNFTGSTRVGRIVAVRAAQALKPALLELGGKAPLLVLEDADLDEAVKAAAFGAFANQGQICMSTERIIVVDAVADAFCEKFAAKARTLTAGDPGAGGHPLGALVDQAAVGHVEGLISDALDQGARRLSGAPAQGVLMSACVIDGVTPNMRLYHEESFGPVVGVIRVADAEEAIRVANDTPYGLASSVFTRDTARGLRVAARIQSGICHVNGPTVHDEAQMPFGGVKASGYGSFGGQAGVEAFTDLRWITVETQPGHYPI